MLSDVGVAEDPGAHCFILQRDKFVEARSELLVRILGIKVYKQEPERLGCCIREKLVELLKIDICPRFRVNFLELSTVLSGRFEKAKTSAVFANRSWDSSYCTVRLYQHGY